MNDRTDQSPPILIGNTVELSTVAEGYLIGEHGPFEVIDRRHLADGSRLVLLHLRHAGKPPCWLYGQQRRTRLRVIDLRVTAGQDGRLIRNELKHKLQNLEGAIYE